MTTLSKTEFSKKKPVAGTVGLSFRRLFIFDIGRGVSGLTRPLCLRDREENLK
jgi:hypothetical protein